MKKLLQLSLLLVGVSSFAQLSCDAPMVLTSNGTVTCPAITGTYKTSCFGDTQTSTGGAMKGNWYTYTPASNGEITLSSDIASNVAPFSTDTEVSVFTGTCAALTCYTSGDNISSTNKLTDITFPVKAGTTYYFQWDNYWNANGFDFDFTFVAISCMKTYAADAGNYTPSSATLLWSNAIGAPSTYDVDWSVDLNAAAGSGTIITGIAASTVNTYSQTNLSGVTPAGSTFRYFVRSNCGLSKSVWSGPYYGYLSKTLPYSTNFEAPNYEDGFNGDGWQFAQGTGLGQNGDIFAYTASSNSSATNTALYSRSISLQANEQVTVKYYTRLYGSGTPTNHNLKVWFNSQPSLTGATATSTGASVTISGITYVQQTATFTAPTAGTYYVIFNDVTPVVSTPSALFIDTVSFTSVLKVNDFLTSKFSVYPNPVNNVINFSNDVNALIDTIDLTDLNGRVIKTVKVDSTQGQISVSDLSAGIYMMRISTDQGMAVKKIIKE